MLARFQKKLGTLSLLLFLNKVSPYFVQVLPVPQVRVFAKHRTLQTTSNKQSKYFVGFVLHKQFFQSKILASHKNEDFKNRRFC
jgi:hypothetical protein